MAIAIVGISSLCYEAPADVAHVLGLMDIADRLYAFLLLLRKSPRNR